MLWFVVAAFIMFRILIVIFSNIDLSAWRIKRKTKYTAGMFVNNFVDSKVLFTKRFREVPSLAVITQTDSTRAYALIAGKLGNEILDTHQLMMYDHAEANTYFTMTVFELTNNRMIEIGANYVEVMYTKDDYAWAVDLVKELATCKAEAEAVEEKTPTVVGFARSAQMN